MLPWVFIDLGSESEVVARWVERACNRAIVEARCTTDPRTVLLPEVSARVLRLQSRGVRIEVDVGPEAKGPGMRARELTFKRQDPARERWRSVGLVVATLVGEIQRDRSPRQLGPSPPRGGAGTAGSGASSGPAQAPVGDATPAASPAAPAPSERVRESEPLGPLTLAEALGSEPQQPSPPTGPSALGRALAPSLPRRFWVGLGATGVPPQADAARRWAVGAEGHALWLQPASLHVAVRYSEGEVDVPGGPAAGGVEALSQRELLALAGLGVWVPAGRLTAVRLSCSVGARYQTFESRLAGNDYDASAWLPDLRGSFGVWQSLVGGVGVWLSAEAATSLAASRALDARTGSVMARVPPAQFGVTAGLGWGR